MTFKALASDPRFLKGLSDNGNKKLQNDDKTRYLIWNIPAVKTCPYATALCKANCYALKAEKQYPSARANRERNLTDALRNDLAERMIYTISAHLSRKVFQNKAVYVRIHESGDFFNRDYACAWLQVMSYFNSHKPENITLTFVFYTKSFTYFIGQDVPSNAAPTASVWADTTPAQLELIKQLGWKIYTAGTPEHVEKACKDKNNFKCTCENCSTCAACFINKFKNIYCVIH